VRRFGVVLAATAIAALGLSAPAGAERYTADEAVKLDVMGEWAHPDDDTSIIGPCGVWHRRYGVRCGIIMVTRGEGGGNAVGTELGPALGLRRENEDRVAHFRSGTVDIFNLDRVDFFYNQSAPLTQFFWGEDETLRRVTRIIRMTQPEIYIGFTPSLAAGHGNHQQAGRYIWEGVKAAADPRMFPEQLRGRNALSTWQVRKVFSGGSTAGTGGTTTAPDCTTGFVPAEGNLSTVAGVWTGYDSPFLWPAGNVQGRPAGAPKIWAQIHSEGASAYPTQSRLMFKGTATAGCSRFGMTDSFVPFQPNADPAAGRDDAILYGAAVPDPGGLPLGTLEHITFSSFFNAPGATFQATVHVRSGRRTLPRGTVALTVPPGWTVDGPKPIGPISDRRESTVTFDVTPGASAAVNANYRVSALLSTGGDTGYTDNVVRIVPPVEGRYRRWGKWEEYDNWLLETAPRALRIGQSPAAATISVGESVTVPVDVHNWSTSPQSGEVRLTLPPNIGADAAAKPYGTLAPGADTTVEFTLTNTDASLPATQTVNIPIETTPGGTETLQMSIVPRTAIPQAAAPTVDGDEGAGEYPGPALDIARRWQGGECVPAGVDCGSSGAPGEPTSTYAKVARAGDDLYFFVHVRDEFQSYAIKPAECVGHWLADSVEILLDPRGNSSVTNMDTATTFKLGIFPFTDDPTNSNGNGPNGPCWSRDADNHQGYSTGPLADTVADPPNAPGVQVASSATWVGTNETTTDHAYAGGGYNLEVKIPMAVLPAAVDPNRLGLNITPYDNDNTAAAGATTLRHIDQSTRLAWSAFGSVQSDPYRWGLATLPGYTPPPDRPTTPSDPSVSSPLNGAESPQTIAQSARDGVPISGRPPTDRLRIKDVDLTRSAVELDLKAGGRGTARIFVWAGEKGYIPVWTTSCSPAADPPPDYGLTACSEADGGTPPWGTDMSGRVLGRATIEMRPGRRHVRIPVDAAAADGGSALVSFETPDDEVQAFDVRLRR
jgi:LmbE family N-acetylglucosaminyl deacetylase